MEELKPVRKVFQGLAVLGGLLLITHGVLLMELNLSPILFLLTIIEVLIGTVTVATDTWFILFT